MAKVIIFSGAGISAESGIPTFRDNDGLWENYNIKDICTVGCLDKNREETIKFYDMLRVGLENKVPNHAHKQIAKIQEKYPLDIQIITQNVDDMFEKAGCTDIMHLHGYLKEVYCSKCNYMADIGYKKQDEVLTDCLQCHEPLRPNIVFFGEQAPMYKDLYESLVECELLIIIGTSGYVIDVKYLSSFPKKTILNNLEPSNAIEEDLLSKVIYKKATDAIDEIVEEIEVFLEESNNK
ncbi:MAG: Sir2 family NAD-dependent protein deacetylase [Campylobacterota bacterium]|nr:Sir2 family NAD-dependent protein deacetylase [Campylobacterota bacterium]